MMNRREKCWTWPLVAVLLALLATGCDAGGRADDRDVGVAEQHVWAKEPTVFPLRQTGNPMPWEDTGAAWPASIASSADLLTGQTTMSIVSRDAQRRIVRTFRKDDEDVFHQEIVDDTPYSGDGAPTVFAWSPLRLDVFWFSTTLGSVMLRHAYLDATTSVSHWQVEDLLLTQTEPTTSPLVASWGTGHLDVFWRDTHSDVRRVSYDPAKASTSGYLPSGWTASETVLFTGAPAELAVTEPSTGEIHFVWGSPTQRLFHRFTVDGGAHWEDVEAPMFNVDFAPARCA